MEEPASIDSKSPRVLTLEKEQRNSESVPKLSQREHECDKENGKKKDKSRLGWRLLVYITIALVLVMIILLFVELCTLYPSDIVGKTVLLKPVAGLDPLTTDPLATTPRDTVLEMPREREIYLEPVEILSHPIRQSSCTTWCFFRFLDVSTLKYASLSRWCKTTGHKIGRKEEDSQARIAPLCTEENDSPLRLTWDQPFSRRAAVFFLKTTKVSLLEKEKGWTTFECFVMFKGTFRSVDWVTQSVSMDSITFSEMRKKAHHWVPWVRWGLTEWRTDNFKIAIKDAD